MKKIWINADGVLRDAALDEHGRILMDGTTVGLEETSLLPVTDQPVICVALNYAEHYTRHEDAFHQPPYNKPPRQPVFFIKPPNTLAGHLSKVPCPDSADHIYTGAGLAFVIGRPSSRVKQEQAFDYVSGYTIFNDFSLAEDSYFRPPITSKCLDGFGPVGPYIVDREDIIDPHNLRITTYVNSELRQTASSADLRLTIPTIIEALTEFMTLQPGMVVVSGFPADRIAVKPGDQVMVEIEQLGSLVNHVVSKPAPQLPDYVLLSAR